MTGADQYGDTPVEIISERGIKNIRCYDCGELVDIMDSEVVETGSKTILKTKFQAEYEVSTVTRACKPCHKEAFRVSNGDLEGKVKVMESSPSGTKEFKAIAVSDLYF